MSSRAPGKPLAAGTVAVPKAIDRVQVTRGLACLLLVLFHVVGGKADDGLRIADASIGRQVLDVLLYVRMPLFAFISGYVYTFKPLDPARPGRFLQGKLRRLALPLLSATTLFYLVALARAPMPPADAAAGLLHAYFFSYEIYWFLQAMLLIFLLLPLLERFLLGSPRGCAMAVLVAFLLTVPAEPFDFLSINGAAFLAPFFFIGIAARRFIGELTPNWTWLLLAILVVAFALHAYNVATMPPHMGARRGTWLSLIIGGISPLLLIGHVPRVALLARIGASSFAIFLFHIFFIVAMRMLLKTLGIESFAIHLIAGLAAAIAGPMLLEALLAKGKVTRRLFLGLR
ncbi:MULTISPECIES: acyltransferase family protein [unclassified Sphingomonas]|uniref:acyltransferase family protein n=1 Tax=unclassified Sphingomonas TaxID=196159 RepID=UPI0006F6125A|nr:MULTISPECIES: acyltransferase [unclassified Sphingomonas]KQX18079.1 acyltransferase [Sphingomonas sp. Root1294]KQY72634.1 acyltransferase [Sphingomonas sp. Root50]KRB87742.1 acyltransferase [Sphingomonas sp. Root720]